MITIYTDGSCDTAKKIGAWAAIIVDESGNEKEITGHSTNTTSNRMELMAVLQGLFTLSKPSKVKIVTDSKYVEEPINKGWLARWVKDEEVDRPHFELWRMFYNLLEIHEIEIEWTRGHSGHIYNERCDILATSEMKKAKKKDFNLLYLAEMNQPKRKLNSEEKSFEENLFNSNPSPFEIKIEKVEEPKVPVSKKKKASKRKKGNKASFYAVAAGRKKGVYLTWAECQRQINKYPGAKFKKFETEAEALNFIRKNK